MNSSRPQELGVFANWRSVPHSILPFAGLEPETHKQLFDFEANCGMDQVSFINPATNLFGVSNVTAATVDTFFPSSFPVHHDYHQNGYIKREDHGCFGLYDRNLYGSSMGLNLGHRTYFSSESSVIDRLFNRSRGFYHTNQAPRCQAEGCKADLSNSKHYHRRHKVCEFHSKATRVIAGGVEQRFCQQCSRFHVLSEFDEVKRSCRKRLADHNRRRRKSHSSGKSPANYTNAGDQKGSSSTLPLLMEKGEEVQEVGRKEDAIEWQPKQEPGLSLGGFVHSDDRNSCFSLSSSSPSGTRDSSAGHASISSATAAACLVVGSSYPDQSQQQPTELHNLLHLGQAMFEVGENML